MEPSHPTRTPVLSLRSVPTGARVAAVAVLIVSVAGYALYGAARQTLTLRVDGAARQVATSASTVGEVLAEAGVRVGDRDLVSPPVRDPVSDGQTIVVRHARPLRLVIDGVPRTLWTTADTVSEALAVADLRLQRASLSVSRSTPLGRKGLSVVVALAQPVDGLTSKRVWVPARTVRRADSSLPRGTTRVVRPGRPGVKLLTYRYQWVDGRQQGRRLIDTRILRPRHDRVVRVGTHVPSRAAVRVPLSSVSGGSLNWDALAACESGGNPGAVNPAGPYYGLYQFDLGTWRSVGGSGLPTQASATEQTRRAQLLYQRVGDSAWPVCGRHLYD